VLRNKSLRPRINELPTNASRCYVATDVTSAILLTRNVDLTSLPIARIVLILSGVIFADHSVLSRMVTLREGAIAVPEKGLQN
jgi:hypothetical protein